MDLISNQRDFNFQHGHGPYLGKGVIRDCVEDFRVEEVLGFEPSGEGEHDYLWIRKTGQNTAWVAEELARILGLRQFDVSFSGLKDRHAVTEQWFSCWLPGKPSPDWSEVEIEGVEILKSIRHKLKLRRGTHIKNTFRLVVRRLTDLTCSKEEIERRLELIAKEGFPNYFGPQRFGHGGRNLDKADLLFNGERQARRKRGMYISAARSYMFNTELSARVESNNWREGGEGWLYGLSPHRDIPAPPLDEKFRFWGEGLEKLDVKAMKRNWLVVPENLDWQIRDESIELAFSLPVGAYATSLLRELIDCEDGK